MGRTEHLRGSVAEVVVVLIDIVNLSSTGSAAAAAQGIGSCSAAEELSGDLAGQWQRSSAVQCVGSGSVAAAAQRRLHRALAAAAQPRSAVFSSQVSGSARRQPQSAVFSSQVSGSAGRWQLQRSVGAQWCLCRSAARCCSTARQRRALAVAAWQLQHSGGALCCLRRAAAAQLGSAPHKMPKLIHNN